MTNNSDMEKKWKEYERGRIYAMILCAVCIGLFVYLGVWDLRAGGGYLPFYAAIYVSILLIRVLTHKASRENFERLTKEKEEIRARFPRFLFWRINPWLGGAMLIGIIYLLFYIFLLREGNLIIETP